jgi:hypothetical protein
MTRRKSVWFRLTRWATVLGAVVSMAIWLATFPFYYFATPGANHHFRIESGRINYRYDPAGFNEDNGIGANREGMRWAPDLRFYPGGSWFVRLPLWIPTLVLTGGAAAMFVIPRVCRRRSHCKCGYALKGLTPTRGLVKCPECGRASEVPLWPRGMDPR